MRKHSLYSILLIAGLAAWGGAASAHAPTDVALSLYGALSQQTPANGTRQSPSNAPGGIVEVRHISNPLVGYEAAYSYNRDNQKYSSTVATGTCPIGVNPPCPPTAASVKANAHEVSADWVVSFGVANIRPFALAGVGVLLNEPKSGQSNTTSETKPVFLYGAGLDWGLLPHLGLRFQ